MAERIEVAIDRDLITSLLQRRELSISHFSCLEARDQLWLKQVFLELLVQKLEQKQTPAPN